MTSQKFALVWQRLQNSLYKFFLSNKINSKNPNDLAYLSNRYNWKKALDLRVRKTCYRVFKMTVDILFFA